MRTPGMLAAVALVVGAAGCIGQTGDGSTAGLEIDCTGLVCDWQTISGDPVYGPTWHQGELGVDLSSEGPIVIELRDVLFVSQDVRQLSLDSVMVRDTTATMAIDVDFYAPGQAAGATFWDRQPVFLVTRHLDVPNHGVFSFHRAVLVPSEGAALIFRVSKDGTGLAMIDELTLG